VALENYVGPPSHQLCQEFIGGWQVFRKSIEDGIAAPNLPDDREKAFMGLKAQLVQRSRVINTVTEGKWGLHEKVRGLLNTCQSLDYIRHETSIMHSSILNQWHDVFIQASKSVAIFEREFQED
jgi:hypothetical protein